MSEPLASSHPEVAALLHSTKNRPITGKDLSAGSHRKMWWQCKLGHEWQRPVYKQVQSQKCPVCIGRRILIGFNDLATTHPEISSEWHPTKNEVLRPTQVSKGSTKKVWWQCSDSHEWQSTVNNRTNLGRGCPVCAGQLRVEGVNDLQFTHPEIANEWHPSKNGSLTPHDVGKGSIRPVWWQCANFHEWKVSPNNRVTQNSGCPFCSGLRVVPGVSDLGSKYKKLAKEWHPKKNGALEPNLVHPGSNKKVWWQCSLGHEWEAGPRSRVEGSGCPVCSNQTVLAGYNDLASTNKELSLEWHPSKNAPLGPTEVAAGSDRKVWWLGSCGHEWKASIGHRHRGKGCPICGNDLIIAGLNDLSTTHADLASEWHPRKNAEITPQGVCAGSNRKAWWLGPCGHEWQAIISNRSRLGAGCPFCSGTRVLAGFNDLASRNPTLAAEWHPTLNGDLKPDQVGVGSREAVWWLGSTCGHAWRQRVHYRSRGHGCTVCWEPWSQAEKQVVEHLRTEFPDLEIVENMRGGFLGLLELDIFIDAIQLGIEFNGEYWHDERRDPSIRERHVRKQRLCDEAGVRLAVIWESGWKTDRERIETELSKIINGAHPPGWMRLSRDNS